MKLFFMMQGNLLFLNLAYLSTITWIRRAVEVFVQLQGILILIIFVWTPKIKKLLTIKYSSLRLRSNKFSFTSSKKSTEDTKL